MSRFDVLSAPAALATHRQVAWEATLLSRDGQELGALEGLRGGSVDRSSTTRLRGSGTLEVVDMGQEVNWLADRVRLDYRVVGGPAWSAGVFMMAAPKEDHTATGTRRSVELTSLLAVLDEDTTSSTLTVPKGTVITDRVRQIIEDAGEQATVTPSTATTSADLMWDPGTPWLTVANDLLDAANYMALDVDADGAFLVRPYTRPQDRPVLWQYAEGSLAVHTPAWGRSQDLGSIPNRVVLTSQAGGDEEPMTATAENDNPNSAWGFHARGRWITHAETGVEAADQATLDALAQRRLIDLSTPSATISASCLPLPLAPLDAVAWDTGGHRARAVVQAIHLDLSPTALMTLDLLEVTS